MPRFEFETSAVLASCTVASGLLFFYHRPREGKIKLPDHNNGILEDTDSETISPETSDPFNVVRQEDFIEGYPIEEEKFWAQIKRRKVGLCFLVTSILVLQCIRLGLYVEDSTGDTKKLVGHALDVYFAVYLFALSAQSISRSTAGQHSESILHITTLTTIPALVLTTLAILPDTPPVSQLSVRWMPPVGDILWYTTVGLYVLACFIAFTTPQGPPLHYPPSEVYLPKTVESITNANKENVTGLAAASPWGYLMFSYTTKVVMLGNTAESLEIGDLPILPADMRCVVNFAQMRKIAANVRLRFGSWAAKTGSGWNVAYQLVRLNISALTVQFWIAVFSAVLFYLPPYFLRSLVAYLETDPERRDRGWGWVYTFGLIMSNVLVYLLTAQLWSISTTTIQTRFRIQLNSILYAKTLVRKDAVSATASAKKDDDETPEKKKEDEDDFSTKAQIMTLMTTDTDRVSEFAWHFFTLVDSPIELVIGSLFVYNLLGVSSLYGLLVIVLSMPLNHFAGKVVVDAQEGLMKARDERIALMNEVLGGIRMLKFMAWERSFEAKVLKIRDRELKYQKINYNIETLWNGIWNATPVLVTLVAFFHFTVIRGQELTPSIAFTSISVFSELKFALNALPETLINALQGFVSLRRIEKYLSTAEVNSVPPLDQQSQIIAFQSCTVTWPQDRSQGSAASSAVSTPRQKFVLLDLSLKFPANGLSLICGKLGSGKTLLLLSLLGETDVLAGQVVCPRSPPNAIASYIDMRPDEKWIVPGLCAYVPQAAWLRNASIKDNILFNLPYNEARYQRTLEVCALVADMDILEDGDESEIGERGVNLSGGQKARVSLARAVYSRASILFLDDVLSAVDAHTAHHLYYECLKGDLMRDRTIILVSHHVQLCSPGADYIVALDNGRVQFDGDYAAFQKSGVIKSLVQSTVDDKADGNDEQAVEATLDQTEEKEHSDSATVVNSQPSESKTRKPRKLVEEEARVIGRVRKDVWLTYFEACGRYWYWFLFAFAFLLAALSPVAENGWLKIWSGAVLEGTQDHEPLFYVGIYAAVTVIGLVLTTIRWFVLYRGSINASQALYKRLLETVLFANIRFHDTVSRGRLLNRFGKDFEGIDSSLSDNFGRTVTYSLSSITTLITVAVVGGFPFVIAAVILGWLYYNVGRVYGQTSRDMRRLDSVTRSPIYSIYGETIAGVTILRSFGASSKFLRDMLRCLDTNVNPYYWMWGVNRWLSIRFNLLSCGVVGAMAVVAVWNPGISASIAGFSLAFASTITGDLLFMVRRFVGLQQSMVALERVKEYSDLKREAPEFVEPRPPASWPTKGEIRCEDLVIRYAPELPDVLHRLNFEIKPGEKVGILGRTGSGKSTLALSFFRFVEATEGRILVDDVDIAKIGLTDLRSRFTIIPQDPTILSGSLRSTLDVFNEYEDVEIFEALRRVHLIPSTYEVEEEDQEVNVNVFRNLDFPVSEGGDNFSTGEKQLLCMARAILKRSKVLVMDEATASVDYSTDELISQTIRHEFADSTILTIAHRLRTVIDYDKVMLLDQGRIIEFDKPGKLLSQPSSKFYALCKATGKDEFATLKKLAGV